LSRKPWLPLMAYHMEREGRHSIVAERIRERHRAELMRAQAASTKSVNASASVNASVEEAARAVRAWLAQRRALQGPASDVSKERAQTPQRGRGLDYDFSL